MPVREEVQAIWDAAEVELKLELDAIRNDPSLSDNEKASRIHAAKSRIASPRASRLKSQRIAETMATRLPFVIRRGQNVLTIVSGRIRATGDIELVLQLVRGGVPISLSNPFVFCNPPILVPSSSGDIVIGEQRYKEDLVEAISSVVESTLTVVAK